jgi:hydrogenase maturation protein HypF
MDKITVKKHPAGTYRIEIRGLVQGVGFRPFVYHVASGLGLKGWVENRNDGVVVMTRGTGNQMAEFGKLVVDHAPVAASIESVEFCEAGPDGSTEWPEDFEIRKSSNVSDAVTEISPDIAVCDQCLEDMQKQLHRLAYPLINCTHCGPRFSIIRDLPYDRKATTMEPFDMCPVCRSEYNDIHDRRFHAQPVACNHCGPTYRLVTSKDQTEGILDILDGLEHLLSEGGLVAMKGTGGYHLACDAFNPAGVRKLREIKQRDGKPFALMFRNLEAAQSYVDMGPAGKQALGSWRRPIVLLPKTRDLTPGIADGLSTLGIMLPYMPFHYLLMEKLKTPALVMTSGNFSEEPILISNQEVLKHFGPRVDGVLTYNREIYNRVDDSVIRVSRDGPMVIRRARGYAPSPLRTSLDLEGILGTGAELAGSFCMGKGHLAFMSQYTGDLKNLETFAFYQEIYERYCRLFRFSPRMVVSDLHPDYLSTRFALKLAEQDEGITHISAQHHHAHIASGMLEAGWEGKVMGFAFDGSGYGTDGHMWGGEVLQADYSGFERLYHFEYMPLPGGDRASKEPWRMAVSYLYHCFGEDMYDLKIPLTYNFSRAEMENITALIQKRINAPLASGAGRLFDAVAAILGLNYYSTYQAEAPMLLESAIDPGEKGRYPFSLQEGRISFQGVIRKVVEDLYRGTSRGSIAAKFHRTMVELILELSLQIRSQTGLDRVVLGGGTFQNGYLSEKVMDKLEKERFKVYLPLDTPVNDQGIAVGQMAIGAHKRLMM